MVDPTETIRREMIATEGSLERMALEVQHGTVYSTDEVQHSAAYLKNWLGVMRSDNRAIFAAASAAAAAKAAKKNARRSA